MFVIEGWRPGCTDSRCCKFSMGGGLSTSGLSSIVVINLDIYDVIA
jgi:hypothetical protein